MSAGAPSAPVSSAPTLPAIYEATRAKDGAVLRGVKLTQAEAVARRKAGGDIVVCGPDTPQNVQLARVIESAAAGGKPIKYEGPHGPPPLWLPHWQQQAPPPEGHSFHETHVRKARTTS